MHNTTVVNTLVCDHVLHITRGGVILTVRFGLHLQVMPDVTMSPDMNKYKFLQRRVTLNYSEGGTERKPLYHVIQSQAIPSGKKIIKSTKSGKVALTFNWKDCGAWVGIKELTE